LRETSFVAPNAVVIGDVITGRDTCVYYHATVRTDGGRIEVGKNVVISDHAFVSASPNKKVIIEDNVIVGANASLEDCVIGNNSVIGPGATVRSGAIVEPYSIVAAGAVIEEGVVVKSN
jgi:carbonic anhydrase/acetyltransferase-like protein (isoleucine patch superfamily)